MVRLVVSRGPFLAVRTVHIGERLMILKTIFLDERAVFSFIVFFPWSYSDEGPVFHHTHFVAGNKIFQKRIIVCSIEPWHFSAIIPLLCKYRHNGVCYVFRLKFTSRLKIIKETVHKIFCILEKLCHHIPIICKNTFT